MRQSRRLPEGGLIDRSRTLRFSFNGSGLEGHPGDTLASALLANDVLLVGRSFKYHRPRGIFTAGVEEPNALVSVGKDGRAEPNTRATLVELHEGLRAESQGGWPTVNNDLLSLVSLFSGLLPAGFYYKTFMWPPSLWMNYERVIRMAASPARPPEHPDPDRYTHRHAHCDVLVVGAGPAGLTAALVAAGSGARVILADDQPRAGGSLLHDPEAAVGSSAGAEWAEEASAKLGEMAGVTRLQRTTVVGHYDHNYLTAVETVGEHTGQGADAPRMRMWRIRARQVVIAAGAIERPLLFANNDLPGVMMADSLEKYINRYAVLPGRRIVLYTNNDGGYRCAVSAAKAGAQVTVVDPRAQPGKGGWPARAREASLDIRTSSMLVSAEGRLRVRRANIAPLADRSAVPPEVGDATQTTCDLVAVSGGWTPTVHLYSQSGGRLRFDDALGAFVPRTPSPVSPARCAGAAEGALRLEDCLAGGAAAGEEAARAAGFKCSRGDLPKAEEPGGEAEPALHIPAAKQVRNRQKVFVDLMNDVTDEDIRLADREGFGSVEHMKRYTAAGFGTDQGKTGNVNALTTLAAAQGVAPAEVGHTTFRPNYVPVPFGLIAGKRTGATYMQRRKTPMHAWHDANGAVYEHVGDWLRPRYFTRTGEAMDEAVRRECVAVREAVGMLDASTLGKIDIQGPDAAAFLDMVYTNTFSTLKQDRGRYGLMLDENGMIFDDGVTFRLGENHFHMTTTTGGAARVMSWLEEWLQTEWPDMRVWCTSVTEQWSVIALAGPMSRHLLGEVTDQQLDSESFPFMSRRDCLVAGVPARIFRISFTGEVAFEINVPASHALHVWERLVDVGGAHGLTPYGTEAMHVLRAEKGYIIAGQDTDGTLTPHDMGLGWLVSKSKGDFLGKRSLARSDTSRDGRRQMVGLLTDDPQKVIPEGAHLVEEASPSIPARMLGNVTSSYMSPTLGHSIALAMVKGGRGRIGDRIHASDGTGGETIPARITEPVFHDPKGEKTRG